MSSSQDAEDRILSALRQIDALNDQLAEMERQRDAARAGALEEAARIVEETDDPRCTGRRVFAAAIRDKAREDRGDV